MATGIILHGGNSDRDTDKNEKFYNEVIIYIDSDAIKVLCVYIVCPERRWEDSYKDDQIAFRRLKRAVGISAGANVLSGYYYSMATDGIREGTGFLDIKVLTHYSEHEPEKREALEA